MFNEGVTFFPRLKNPHWPLTEFQDRLQPPQCTEVSLLWTCLSFQYTLLGLPMRAVGLARPKTVLSPTTSHAPHSLEFSSFAPLASDYPSSALPSS